MNEKELLNELEHELELLQSGIEGGFWASSRQNLRNAKAMVNLLKSVLK